MNDYSKSDFFLSKYLFLFYIIMSEANSQKFLDIMKIIQENILQFLKKETNSEDNFKILEDIFKDTKIKENKHELLSLLHLISRLANGYHLFVHILDRIELIIQYLKKDMKTHFTNSEIFNIFKSNKKIILFLAEEQIIIFDDYIVKKITTTPKYVNAGYPQYFHPEIQPFVKKKWFTKYEVDKNKWILEIRRKLPENFYEKRKKGENDTELCEMIRKCKIKEFVMYINQCNISPNAKIQPSIYETNPFLIKKQVHLLNINQKGIYQFFPCTVQLDGLSMIEYAVFYGSFQIYDYLRFKVDDLKESLWPLSIYSQNLRLIHSFEDDIVDLNDNTDYKLAFYESIKCHNDDIENYFLNNFLQEEEVKKWPKTIYQSLKYYNFEFLKNELIDESLFLELCKNDHCKLVDSLLKGKVIDINQKDIYQFFCYSIFKSAFFNKIHYS